MAFTTTRQPAVISPVNNELTFIVSSSDYALTNFKYVFDLYVNGTKVLRTKLFPLVDGTCLIDFSSILKDYIHNDNPNFGCVGFVNADEGDIIEYYINYFTECDVLGLVDHGNSSSFYTWNAIANWEEKSVWNGTSNLTTFINTLIPNASITDGDSIIDLGGAHCGAFEVLFNSKYQNIIYEEERKNISFFVYNSGPTRKAYRITVTTPTGKIRRLDFTNGSIAYPKNRIGIFGIGLDQLNELSNRNGWTYTVNDEPITIADEKIFIQITSSGGALPISKIMTFNILPNCNRYDRCSVMYTNRYGVWSSLPFMATNYKKIDLEKSVWQTVDKYNDGYYTTKRNTFSNKVETTIEFSTDWISNQFDIDNIIDMLKSPKIFISRSWEEFEFKGFIESENVTTKFEVKPAMVKNSTYNWSNKKQEKLIQYRVEFIYGFNEKTRR